MQLHVCRACTGLVPAESFLFGRRVLSVACRPSSRRKREGTAPSGSKQCDERKGILKLAREGAACRNSIGNSRQHPLADWLAQFTLAASGFETVRSGDFVPAERGERLCEAGRRNNAAAGKRLRVVPLFFLLSPKNLGRQRRGQHKNERVCVYIPKRCSFLQDSLAPRSQKTRHPAHRILLCRLHVLFGADRIVCYCYRVR